jgi:hypothetical protein
VVPIPEDYCNFSAIRFRQNIVSALEGEAVHDPRIVEFNLMEKFKWTYDELLAIPFHVIVSIGFIQNSKAIHEKLHSLKGGTGSK